MSLAQNCNPVTQTDQFLLKKKGVNSNGKSPNAFKNLIKNQQEQEDYKQSKPFSKKYGPQNTTTKSSHKQAPEFRQSASNEPKSQKEIAATNGKAQIQHKNHTKQSFNKRLNSNIIKDQTEPSLSQNQQNIAKRAEGKLMSPKKTRDNLTMLNEEENKVQREILEIHKSTKVQLAKIRQIYKIEPKKIAAYLSQIINEQQKAVNWQLSQNNQKGVQKLDQLLKQKSRQLSKLQHKIAANAYMQFLEKTPFNIDQMNSSEEDDVVEQLPKQKPRLQGNHSSYAITMSNMKHKNYALNQRRTYDVFKNEEQKGEAQTNLRQIEEQTAKQEVIKQEGQNRMTMNQKFKDFLLN